MNTQFKVKGQVTFPTLQTKPGEAIHVKIVKAIEQSKSKVVKKGQENREPAKVMQVIDLEDIGAGVKQVVCNKVLVGVFEELGAEVYVGKCYRIVKDKEKRKGDSGDYYRFNVDEIEEPAEVKAKAAK